MKRFLWLGFVLFFYLICSGCGDTFRPIIIPNPPTFPNPAAAHTVVAINDNAPNVGVTEAVAGTAMVIDVSGSSEVSEFNVGLAPVHAVQQTANEVLVANHSVAGTVSDSLTRLNFNGTVIGSANTFSLPPGSGPNFVAVAPLDTMAYVSLPNLNAVAVVNTQSNSQQTIQVGSNPVALAVTPDRSKLYVANQGDGTISGFNTKDLSKRTISPANTSSPPIWLLARSDNQRVYVLEQNGTLAWMDTTATLADMLTETSISVPGATTMIYDGNKNRLYVPGGPQLAIIDVSQSAPALLAAVPVPPVPGVPPVNASAVAVTALPDGSRAYVASVPSAAQPSQVSISGVAGDGTTATYSYALTGGHDLTPGLTVVVSGLAPPNDVFNGTFVVNFASNAVAATTCDQPAAKCTFQADNKNVAAQTAAVGTASTAINNLFPQVSVVRVNSNTISSTIGMPGFPDATVSSSQYYVPNCATTRFRFMMAAGGDSSHAYLSSCDGGGVDIIQTSDDSYVEDLPAPIGVRMPIGQNQQNPPQNPVFLIAGP